MIEGGVKGMRVLSTEEDMEKNKAKKVHTKA